MRSECIWFKGWTVADGAVSFASRLPGSFSACSISVPALSWIMSAALEILGSLCPWLPAIVDRKPDRPQPSAG